MAVDAPEVDLLSSIESGTADRRILEFAARGFVPLAPGDLVRAVGSVLAAGEPGLARIAEATFLTFSFEALREAVQSDGVRTEQLDVIARRSKDPAVLEPIIQHKAVADETLAWLAERVPPPLQDVLVTNHVRLLASPVIVERLFENPELSSDIRRRADEFLEEFFLKRDQADRDREVEPVLDESGEVLPEAEEAGEDRNREKVPPGVDPDHVLTDDEKQSLFTRLAKLTVAQRIKLAYTGNREERLYLIRDTNRLVTAAVLKSPKTNQADAEVVANMKSVSEDVLRSIGNRREWVKKYTIVLALARNPRAPVTTTIALVSRLTARDQKTLSTDRNIPEVVRVTARRAVTKRMD